MKNTHGSPYHNVFITLHQTNSLFFLYLFFTSQLHTPLFMGTGDEGYQLTVVNFTPLISNSIL